MNSRRRACIICQRNRRLDDTTRLFKFPRKTTIMYQLWLSNCQISPSETDMYICDKHFISTDIDKKMLNKNAIPVLFLKKSDNKITNGTLSVDDTNSDTSENESMSNSFEIDSKVSVKTENISIDPIATCSNGEGASIAFEFIEMKSEPIASNIDETLRELNSKELICCGNCYRNEASEEIVKNELVELERKNSQQDKLIESNQKIIEDFQLQIKNQEKKIAKLSNRLKICTLEAYIDDQTHMSESAKRFVKMQVKTTNIWNDEDKTMAKDIYLKSPEIYKYLRNSLGIHLPTQSSIIAWVSKNTDST